MDEKCNKMLCFGVFFCMFSVTRTRKRRLVFSLELLKNKEQLKVLLHFLPYLSKKVLLGLKLAI